MTKKVTWAIYRPDEKSYKKHWKVGIEVFITDNTKSSQINTWPVSEHIRKIVELTDSNHIIYWTAIIA